MRFRRVVGAWWLVASVGGGLAAAAPVGVTVTQPNGAPLAGAVVFLESAQAAQAAKPLPNAEMAQEKKEFAPGVLVVTRGTSVTFPNRDTVRHHVYSFSPAKKFELKLYTGTPANPVEFDRTGIAVLGCNIHDNMVGWVVVVDTPYHGIAGANGQVVLDAPPGKYTLRTWHPRLPVGQEAAIQALDVVAVGAKASVKLGPLQP
jgi:plastocyanin